MKSEKIQKIQKLYENVEPSSLNDREKLLLELLFSEKEPSFFNQLEQGRYRILQFRTSDFPELEETLKLLLPDFVGASRKQKLVVEKFSGDNLTKSELLDVIHTLSQDTGIEISIYVGRFADKEALSEIYESEALIFSEDKSFSEYILNSSLKKVEDKVLQEIRKALLNSKEDQSLVKALYHTEGNQSQAAKLLYVHRNTLLNKIKKYEQKYGLQLSGSDLVLAFNLI